MIFARTEGLTSVRTVIVTDDNHSLALNVFIEDEHVCRTAERGRQGLTSNAARHIATERRTLA